MCMYFFFIYVCVRVGVCSCMCVQIINNTIFYFFWLFMKLLPFTASHTNMKFCYFIKKGNVFRHWVFKTQSLSTKQSRFLFFDIFKIDMCNMIIYLYDWTTNLRENEFIFTWHSCYQEYLKMKTKLCGIQGFIQLYLT